MRAPSPALPRPRRVRRAAALLVGAVLLVGSTVGGPSDPARAASTDRVVLGAPAYFASDVAGQWNRLLNLSGMKHIVITDNAVADPMIRGFVDQAKAKAITTYAYVSADYAPTGAGRKTPQTIQSLQAAIATKMALAPAVGGVFVDEVLNVMPDGTCTQPAAYFRTMYQWFKAAYPGKTYVLNPGTVLCSEFADTADIFMFFESNRDFYYSAFKPYYALSAFDWIRALPNERVWMIMYGVSAGTFQQDVDDMANTAGVVWVDPDLAVATVYDALPDTTLLTLLSNRAVATSVSGSVTVSTNVVVGSPSAAVSTVVSGAATSPATIPPVSTFPPLTQLPGPVPTTTTPPITSPTLPILQAPTTLNRSLAVRRVTTTTKRKATTRKTTRRTVKKVVPR